MKSDFKTLHMKRTLYLLLFLVFETGVFPQAAFIPVDSIPEGYFITHSRSELIRKFSDLPLGININDSIPSIIKKLETFTILCRNNYDSYRFGT